MFQTKKNEFYFTVSIIDDDFSVISNSLGAYEIESLNKEIKRNIIEEGFFTESNYPFTLKLNFSALVSIIEISSNITCSQIAFKADDSGRDLLGFKTTVIHEEYKLSDYPVDILCFDNIFFETDMARGMNFRGKRSGIMHNFTMDVGPGFKYIEHFCEVVQWYMMESKDIVPSICF